MDNEEEIDFLRTMIQEIHAYADDEVMTEEERRKIIIEVCKYALDNTDNRYTCEEDLEL